MKRNSRISQDDEIDLGEIIKTLWHEKILILSISLIFMVAGYIYGALQPKIYKTEITIREAPAFFFEAYSSFFNTQQQQQGISGQFNEHLKLNLSSLDTLVQFVEETNTINDFKNHLKEKNISARNYFREKFKSVNNKNIQNKYSLTYSEPLPGEAFLNDYIIFVWHQTMTMFKQQLIKKFWNEKILIFSISFIFMVIGYVYGALQPKIYKTEITIREAPLFFLEAYNSFLSIRQQQLSNKQQQDIARQFNDNLKLNLSSLDTLVQFVEETNTIDGFKNHLKEQNIEVRDYFNGKFKAVIDKNIRNKYSLTYSQPLPGPSFLNDYIIFAQQQLMTVFKQRLKQTLKQNIINEINIHKNHLEIAKEIGLENPLSILNNQVVTQYPQELFFKGTIVLTRKIANLNKLLNEDKNLTLDYNPILEYASSLTVSTSLSKIITVAFVIGLFFSITIIIIRSAMLR